MTWRASFLVAVSCINLAASGCAATRKLDGPFVFTAEQMRQQDADIRAFVGGGLNASYWTPNNGQVIDAIASAMRYLLLHLEADYGYRTPDDYEARYTHQVFGLKDLGQDVVVVLGVCRSVARSGGVWDAANELIFELDGGSCFFRAQISIATKQVTSFSVNSVGG